MELRDFTGYEIAHITSKDEIQITELEKSISAISNKDIVLIAYQSKDSKDI